MARIASILCESALNSSLEMRVGRLNGGTASVPVRLRSGFVRSARAGEAGEWAAVRVRAARLRAAKVWAKKCMVAVVGKE